MVAAIVLYVYYFWMSKELGPHIHPLSLWSPFQIALIVLLTVIDSGDD
jgi:hypothetical protein